MTIAQWFDENGIENLPILNICVCRGMKKEITKVTCFCRIPSLKSNLSMHKVCWIKNSLKINRRILVTSVMS